MIVISLVGTKPHLQGHVALVKSKNIGYWGELIDKNIPGAVSG